MLGNRFWLPGRLPERHWFSSSLLRCCGADLRTGQIIPTTFWKMLISQHSRTNSLDTLLGDKTLPSKLPQHERSTSLDTASYLDYLDECLSH